LVPGDIVLLQSGDKVPADLRLLTARNLRIDESALTGESEAVEKSNRLTASDAVIAERFCMAYSGTLIVYGQGTGIVVATGESTEIGCISRMLVQIDKLNTPLLRKIADFGHRLAIATLLLAIVVFTYSLFFQGYGIGEIFLATFGMAVAAIPEELPPIITIALALGVQSMARHAATAKIHRSNGIFGSPESRKSAQPGSVCLP
jgi:P-type E1-E2 ATPase